MRVPCELNRYGSKQAIMNRTMFAKALGVLLVFIVGFVAIFWAQISESYGPMRQTEAQCLICQRDHVQKWVCGSKVNDEIITNQYSDWIDTFIPLNHQHVWAGHTAYNRAHWFGSTSIACGGIATIPRIFEQRSRLGELEAQNLATKYHEVIKGQSSKIDFNELDSFMKAVVDDPKSLLKDDPQG